MPGWQDLDNLLNSSREAQSRSEPSNEISEQYYELFEPVYELFDQLHARGIRLTKPGWGRQRLSDVIPSGESMRVIDRQQRRVPQATVSLDQLTTMTVNITRSRQYHLTVKQVNQNIHDRRYNDVDRLIPVIVDLVVQYEVRADRPRHQTPGPRVVAARLRAHQEAQAPDSPEPEDRRPATRESRIIQLDTDVENGE